MEKNASQTMYQMDAKFEDSDNIRDCKLVDSDLERNILESDLIVQSLAECPKVSVGSTENLPEVDVGSKKEKTRKDFKKKAKIQDEIQNVNHDKMDLGSTAILAKENVNGQRKGREGKNVKNKDEIQKMDKVNDMLYLHLSDGNHGEGIDGNLTEECSAQESGISIRKKSSILDLVHNKENSLALCNDEEAEVSVRKEQSSPDLVNGDESPLDLHKDEGTMFTRFNEGQCSAEGRSIFSTYDGGATLHLFSSGVKEPDWSREDLGPYPRISPIPSIRRKLIVLDVNGLLASIVMPAPKDCRGDVHILGRAIFRRPFCDDFLKFCFQNFDVGVWSSRSKKLIDRVVDYLFGDLKDKLLFCWDMSHSTQTGFNTLENIHKPLVCKELKKIWENDDSNLPWKKGTYNESNTLLLDDSPYKALLNPLHTAIFPISYHYEDKNDNSLGPGGDLRVYLEGLLTSENVQKYVEQHPFGQGAINETNLSWGFYSGVLQTLNWN